MLMLRPVTTARLPSPKEVACLTPNRNTTASWTYLLCALQKNCNNPLPEISPRKGPWGDMHWQKSDDDQMSPVLALSIRFHATKPPQEPRTAHNPKRVANMPLLREDGASQHG